MAFIPIPRGIRVCFPITIASQNVEFCVTVQKASGSVVPADFDAIESVIESGWDSTLRSVMSNLATLARVIITDVSTEGGPQSIYPFVQTGTVSSAALPNNAALVVSHRTAKRGRSYRGRSYFTGIPLSAQNSATDVSSTYATNLATAFSTLMDAIGASGYPHVVASKQHNGVVSNPATVAPVQAYVVDTHFDSQRRRLFGRGT